MQKSTLLRNQTKTLAKNQKQFLMPDLLVDYPLRRLKKRLKRAKPVSKIGTARISKGITDEPLPGISVTQIEISANT